MTLFLPATLRSSAREPAPREHKDCARVVSNSVRPPTRLELWPHVDASFRAPPSHSAVTPVTARDFVGAATRKRIRRRAMSCAFRARTLAAPLRLSGLSGSPMYAFSVRVRSLAAQSALTRTTAPTPSTLIGSNDSFSASHCPVKGLRAAASRPGSRSPRQTTRGRARRPRCVVKRARGLPTRSPPRGRTRPPTSGTVSRGVRGLVEYGWGRARLRRGRAVERSCCCPRDLVCPTRVSLRS